jgi:hypothetical protein
MRIEIKLLCIMIFCLLFSDCLSAQEEHLTAMEYKTILDDYVTGWSNNATLTGVYVWGVGSFTFTYSDFNNSISAQFFVSTNGTINNGSTNSEISPKISNWTIDSDEVESILNTNFTFSQYINEVPDANGDLWLAQNETKTIWYFI